jgi:ABC-type transport system involved in cytochrome bd biosynthesis fused ATPase/permease subunit
MVLNDFFTGLPRSEKLTLIQSITKSSNPWTLVAVSNDPLIMAACDRVVVLEKGKIKSVGSFSELTKNDMIKDFID